MGTTFGCVFTDMKIMLLQTKLTRKKFPPFDVDADDEGWDITETKQKQLSNY